MTELPAVAPERKNLIEEYLGLALIFVQLVLIILVMREMDIVGSGFRRVLGIAAVGFVIHHLLPFKLRLPFFVLLSVGSMFLILGSASPFHRLLDPLIAMKRVGIILAIGIVLIGICHLPISFWKRAGLLLGAGVGMGMFRAGIFPSGGLEIVWIVLAAMFMFRIVVYLYDISTSPKRPSLKHALAYFFLMPNVCFTLFPVIDFKTFCNSHYNESPLATYQKGMRWMLRGVIQLILYRFIQQLFYLKAADVASGTDLIQFLITNSFLYLKVSGQFHLIVGLLLLFGFNLPETNHFYFLASSFTDYWRRVNIYWKDFMLKVFYYPAFFKLKKYGPTKALIISTLWVFFVTWALHLYQTWWLRGSATVTWTDALFWSILGLLVLLNSLREMKKSRKRTLAAGKHSAAEAIRLVLKTAGTFACISLLWSLWSAPGVLSWVHLWTYADIHTLLWGAVVLAAVMLAKFVLEILPARRTHAVAVPAKQRPFAASIKWDVLRYAAPLLVIFVVSHLVVQSSPGNMETQLFQDVLVTGDSRIAGQGEGYYENLTGGVDKGERQLWESLTRTSVPVTRYFFTGANPVRPVKDFRYQEPIPSVHMLAYETEFKTNRWGMRDLEYDMVKPEGTVRIAVLGSSHTMGWGVRQDETFEALVEERLNREFSSSFSPGTRYEVLNFAFNGFSPLGQISLMQNRVRAFNPDIIIYVAKLQDFNWVNRDLIRFSHERIPIPYEFLQETLSNARVTSRTPYGPAENRLRPFGPAVVSWSFNAMVNESRSMNALPVCIPIVFPTDLSKPEDSENGYNARSVKLKALALEAGFTVVDMSQLLVTQNPSELLTKGQLPHCNPRAHALIADALYKNLTTNPKIDLANTARRTSLRVAGGNENKESGK